MVTVVIILILAYLLANGLSGKYQNLYLKEKELRIEERERYEMEIFELAYKKDKEY